MPDNHVYPLNAELAELRFMAGRPSFRSISRAIGCSHTTVAKAFAPGAIPSWEILHLVVRQLDGDVDTFRKLWCDAVRKQENIVSGTQNIAAVPIWRIVTVLAFVAIVVCAGMLLMIARPSTRHR
ncbi:hypothetical protein BKG77_11010 [Mycobacteroides chelonae]|uniref:hypothetical protein n=1 Tax=Mycobacteroides chelonae TaxID=1774 RepID=UPI0008A911AB|nr:hypothetical protein [Mycobacteroides chelonae]OHU24071.1 hypothetical protein BKG77_11010 [Mycobacteroides chelonae]OHU47450.1 hypothetical protein BKG78_00015 [Mycobacteroides chelonae]OHU62217.1 hypothetical protein BKG85_11620 [Mycobacteroides chelonae]